MQKKFAKVASIKIYFDPRLKTYGLCECDGKDFVIKIKKNLKLKDFLNTLYHELTHVIIGIMDIGNINKTVNNITCKEIRVLKLAEKEEEKVASKIAKVSTLIIFRDLFKR